MAGHRSPIDEIPDGHRWGALPRRTSSPRTEAVERATVLEICQTEAIPCHEGDLTLEEAYRADELFCTGTMGELAGVVKLDDRVIGNGEIGPMTQRLSDLFAKRTALEGETVV